MSRVFAKMPNVDFCVPTRPHVAFEEGGHLFIEPSDKDVSERREMSAQQLSDMAFATQLLGDAMWKVFPRHGIELYRINYQDNGNWAFLRGDDKPLMHIHLYGRAVDEKKQSYGQALVFPDPNDPYYDDIAPVPDDVLFELFECMKDAITEGALDAPFVPEELAFVLDDGREAE